ncbi:unnamed protein product [Cyprideis torosa]|uniref:Uncharacterized protein n=1 Tax=Cyprideis torosa TaxID=163714 RepID=A0A7R8ZKB1_9CRUS|nr:unnamed protein product [Cyprideis torosa]CAG0879874.1 unnamed protein product [Cyprideis torosa]
MDILTVIFFAWIFFSIAIFKLGTMLHEQLGLTENENKNDSSARKLVRRSSKTLATTRTLDPFEHSAVEVRESVVESCVSTALFNDQASLEETELMLKNAHNALLGERPKLPGFSVPREIDDLLAHPPTASGSDPESVEWINDVFRWLHSLSLGKEARETIFKSWMSTLTDLTRRSSTLPGVLIEVEGRIEDIEAPTFQNLVLETGPCDSVTITCDTTVKGKLQAVAITSQGIKRTAVFIKKLRGRLNVACIADEIMAIAKFDGWPEVELEVLPIDQNIPEQIIDSIKDQLPSALRNAVVDLNFKHLLGFPRLIRTQSRTALAENVGPDPKFKGAANTSDNILVKVVKATGLGSEIGSLEPYCVIEMDFPPQRRQTTVRRETNCPFWDQTFLFELAGKKGEIMFEVHDKREKKFLGLCIVSIEEILKTPSQRQIIPLQPRPYGSQEEEPVSGSLTVEFLFMEKGSVVSESAVKKAKTPQTSDEGRPRSSSQRRASYKSATDMENQEGSGGWATSSSVSSSVSGPTTSRAPADKGPTPRRGRRKTRDFLKSIRNRLSRSGNRSKSLEPNMAETNSSTYRRATDTPSSSLDRQGDRSRSVPANEQQTDFLKVPSSTPSKEMGRSSSSVNSDLSHSSVRTFTTMENSTLVLEVVEEGIRRYFLIPPHMSQQQSRWRGSGSKIHIFNNHCFVAKHIPSSSRCGVCGKPFPLRREADESSGLGGSILKQRCRPLLLPEFRFQDALVVLLGLGKQGYECRDCYIQTHKPCHCKMDDMCPVSSVPTMDIEALLGWRKQDDSPKTQQTGFHACEKFETFLYLVILSLTMPLWILQIIFCFLKISPNLYLSSGRNDGGGIPLRVGEAPR